MGIGSILLALLIFSALVFIHELGHFLVARACGVRVLEFALGMGPKLFAFTAKRSGTTYSIRLFPIGGYVNMLGEDGMELVQGQNGDDLLVNNTADENVSEEPTEAPAQEEEKTPVDPELAKHAYCNQSVWRRILISIAGPAMNLVLGFLLMFVMIVASGSGSVASTVVAGFHIAYSGEESHLGFEPGDYLYSFDTPEDINRICSMDQVLAKADSLAQGTVDVYVNRYNENKTKVVQVLIEDVPLTREFVETYFTTSLSEQSGLQIGDEILKINSTRVHTGHELSYEITNQGHTEMKVTVLRNGETVELNVRIPNFQESGATFGNMDFLIYAESNFGLGTILKHTWFRSCSTVKMVFDSLFGLFSGRYSVEAVSGPIGITKTISDVAQTGWLNVLYLVVVISINLGVMNLLPFPALDGGHLMIYFIEIIRRKPMKRELEGIINFVGLLILLSLAVLIAIKDIISL